MANRHIFVLSAGALAAFGLACAPAHAASPAVAQFAKSEAILGAPSRLAAILADQGAPVRAAPVQPSSVGLKRPFTFSNAVALGTPPTDYNDSGKPDIFGTVALEVGRTSLDRKWRRVAGARVSGRAAAYARSLRNADEQGRLEAVNDYVNSRVRFVADSRQHRRADFWTAANQTLSAGRGDCEDYAIAKLQMLRTAGFSDEDLYLVILKDLVRRSDHAVAVVRSGGRMLVLDNGTDRIVESHEVSDYRPIMTFAASGTWTHGYRVRRAPLQVATAQASLQRLVPSAD